MHGIQAEMAKYDQDRFELLENFYETFKDDDYEIEEELFYRSKGVKTLDEKISYEINKIFEYIIERTEKEADKKRFNKKSEDGKEQESLLQYFLNVDDLFSSRNYTFKDKDEVVIRYIAVLELKFGLETHLYNEIVDYLDYLKKIAPDTNNTTYLIQ